ncbi:D-alanyl-D-alanine carboxypeptidase family protein [Aestuariibius insulae]|uniref:D-alanyl-D-alanine carboxypeptidase family protein n=1 Tax=Aestuariibius insulae TaxID=2058287 RepID=UPI00345EC743
MLTRLCLGLTLLAAPAVGQSFDTRAEAAYMIDQTTGTVLLEKNANEALPPASMSKLMTLYMTFEAVADGRLTLGEELPVSAHAASFGGSTMFLDTTDRVSVEDLIRGIIVLSGNDACVVLAEAISPDGTEAGFARMMTSRARQLGMEDSVFQNSSGWPAAGHVMSMKDLAILAERLIEDFPTYYPLFAEQEFAFDGRAPANTRNRNPLLGLGIGVDGLKTGHTQEAGFGLTGSAEQGDRRVIFVITGLDTAAQRAEEAERLVTWAFRQFAQKELGSAGTYIAEAPVWMGSKTSVDLVLPEDTDLLVPILNEDGVEATVSYRGPLEAPISEGDSVAELVITFEGLPETRLPLVAGESIDRGGFTPTLRTAAQVLMEKAGLTEVIDTAAETLAVEPAS